MTDWALVGPLVGDGEPVSLRGLNPWHYKWRLANDIPVYVPHPEYPSQQHLLRVYEIRDDSKSVQFAAGELSNGVWGVYLPLSDLS
jgi:hypothetical protein